MNVNTSDLSACKHEDYFPFATLEKSNDLDQVCAALNKVFVNALSTSPSSSCSLLDCTLQQAYTLRVTKISSSVFAQIAMSEKDQERVKSILRCSLAASDILRLTARYFEIRADQLDYSSKEGIETETHGTLHTTAKAIRLISTLNADDHMESLTIKCLKADQLDLLSNFPVSSRPDTPPIILDIVNSAFSLGIGEQQDSQSYQLAYAKFLLDYARHAPLKSADQALLVFDSHTLLYDHCNPADLLNQIEGAWDLCHSTIHAIDLILQKEPVIWPSWDTYFRNPDKQSNAPN